MQPPDTHRIHPGLFCRYCGLQLVVDDATDAGGGLALRVHATACSANRHEGNDFALHRLLLRAERGLETAVNYWGAQDDVPTEAEVREASHAGLRAIRAALDDVANRPGASLTRNQRRERIAALVSTDITVLANVRLVLAETLDLPADAVLAQCVVESRATPALREGEG
jgi:hypothetical protein